MSGLGQGAKPMEARRIRLGAAQPGWRPCFRPVRAGASQAGSSRL